MALEAAAQPEPAGLVGAGGLDHAEDAGETGAPHGTQTRTYTLDAMGNQTKEELTDPDGQLARSQTKVYDALSRLQNLVLPR